MANPLPLPWWSYHIFFSLFFTNIYSFSQGVKSCWRLNERKQWRTRNVGWSHIGPMDGSLLCWLQYWRWLKYNSNFWQKTWNYLKFEVFHVQVAICCGAHEPSWDKWRYAGCQPGRGMRRNDTPAWCPAE